MKVLMVTYLFPPRYSGAVIQSIYLAKELMRQGINVEFVSNNYTNKTVIDYYEGIKVYKINSYFDYEKSKFWILRNFIYMLKVLFLSIRSGADIVFFQSLGCYDSWIFPVLTFLKKKTIVELTLVGADDPLSFKNSKLGFLNIYFLRTVNKIIPISSRLKELSIQAGIDEKQLEQIPVGVNVEKFIRLNPDQRKILKEHLGFSDKEYVFIAVGQVEDRKDYKFMIKAWNFINKQYPKAILLIAGPQNDASNEYFQDLLRYIQAENITNVKFLGKVNNVNEYMRISDCLLHCSIREGLPNTLLEASIASVPIVCKRMEGITSDIILNSNIGRECVSDDPKDFADLVFALFRERNTSQIDSDFSQLKSKFGIEQVAKKFIIMFNSLLSK